MTNKTIKEAVRAVCHTDPSITESRIETVIAALEGKKEKGSNDRPFARAYARGEVAAFLGVTPKTVTGYAKRGLLIPLYTGAGAKRARSYTGESVMALLSGKINMAMQ
jgi:hypothetical protein